MKMDDHPQYKKEDGVDPGSDEKSVAVSQALL